MIHSSKFFPVKLLRYTIVKLYSMQIATYIMIIISPLYRILGIAMGILFIAFQSLLHNHMHH